MLNTVCLALALLYLQPADEDPFGAGEAAVPAATASAPARVAERIALLTSEDPVARASAAAYLREARDEAASAVGPLTVALGDPNVSVRAAAACALGCIGVSTPEAVTALTAALADPEPEVAGWAALAPGVMHAQGDTLVPAVLPLLDHPGPDAEVRAGARRGLVGDADDAALAEALRGLTGHEDVSVSQAAEAALRVLQER